MTIPLDLFDPYPSRQEVDSWSWEHLEALVAALTAWMTQQVMLRQMHMFNMKTPGGTDWHGDANDAAVDLASNDTNKVMAEVAVAAKARQIAMDAIAEQMQLKGIAEDAIEQVEAQGFSVQPDWTPKDLKYSPPSTPPPARAALAGEYKQDLILRAQALQLADRETTRQLGQQMAAMRKEQFSPTGQFTIQPVDNKTPTPSPDHDARPSQTHALDHKDKPAVPAPGPQPDPAARFGSQPRLDPSTPEGRKQLEDIRQQMQGPASPTAPPNATSGIPLQGLPVAPSVPRPEAPITPPAPPGFMDGVAAAASDMVNHLADTTGFHGSEAAKNAFIQNVVAMFLQANPNIAGPVNTMNTVRDAMEHPQPASYLAGKQAFDTWIKLAGIALPDAGALGRLGAEGAEGAGAGTLAGSLGRAPEGMGTRTPLGEPRPLGPHVEEPAAQPAEKAPVPPVSPSPYQLPDRAQLTTPRDGAFFWSGRDADGLGVGPTSAGGSGAADRFAGNHHGTTLEGLLESKGIQPPRWSPTDVNAEKWWEDVSRMYAENASGEVRAVVGSNLRPGNVWETVELPRLMENPNVTKIIVINPDTGVETTVFSR